MNIIDGKKIRDEILFGIKKEISSLSFQPIFCDILVGEDPSSVQYVNMKSKVADSLGIKFHKANFPNSITTEELIKEIKFLNNVPNMCGIIIQLPLPENIDRKSVLDAIDLKLDVDCLGSVASSLFYSGKTDFGFPTALACVKLLESVGVNLNSYNIKNKIVVLGKGDLVGKPVVSFLKSKGFSPFVIDTRTEDKEEIIKNADIIISGMGCGKFITGNMVKEGVIIIDAGTSESNNSIVGDVDIDSMKNLNGFVSPVPGGVGPVTIAMLFKNVLNVAKQLQKRYE